MHRRGFLILTGLLLFGLTVAQGYAADKMQFGANKDSPAYYLTILAAEEKGFWKEQGAEVEWAAMRTGADTLKAVAAGSISMGVVGVASLIPAMTMGVPAVIVSNVRPKAEFFFYIRADSPYKEVRDLRGARIGVTALGSVSHVYARVVTKAAGIEKEVKFVGAGGITVQVAALKAKAIDASLQSSYSMIPLVLAGEARELAAVADYLPKEWADQTVFARRDIVRDKPEVVRRVVKGMVRAADFVMTNRAWSVEKIKAVQGYSTEMAGLIFERVDLSRTGKIERKAMENIRNFVMEYEIVPKGATVPPVEELFTTRFTD